jgi:uncharacterized SAM-binding protein YcdF (DUF218 family)
VRILRRLFLLLSFAAILASLAFGYLCLMIDRSGRRDLAQPAEAVVVLGAAVLPDGQAGPDLASRTQHAVSLYQRGLATQLICAGGVKDDPSSAAAVCKTLAVSYGVPEDSIRLADGSCNTEEDAHQAASVMRTQGWRTAIVVSHPLHVYRAKLFFEKEGLVVYTSPTTTDVDGIHPVLRAYYTIREGVGVLWPYLEQAGFPSAWTAALQEWVYAGP